MSRSATARVIPFNPPMKKVKVKPNLTDQGKKKKPEPILDDIFFHKSQLKLGKTLICYGRLDPLSEWDITHIETHELAPRLKDGFRWVSSKEVRYLSDKIYLKNKETGITRICTFSNMSYSAIWRLKA